MDQPSPHILRALMSWYADQLDRGVTAGLLPQVVDLETIAATPGVTRLMLPELPLVDEAALMPYASGVMMTVRTARQAFAAAPPEQPAAEPPPTVPPPTAAPVAPSAPTRRTRPQPGTPPTGPVGPRVGAQAFTAFDLLRPSRPPVVLTPELQPSAAGTRIGWQGPAGAGADADAVRLYRVVSRDDVLPWNPDEADLIAVTTATQVHDPRPLPLTVRYVQVWEHTGPSELAARAAQPTLLREGLLLAPPTAVAATEDHGSVVLSWSLPPGLTRVELHRIVLTDRHGAGYDDADVLLAEPARTNFHDTTCLPGTEYEYRLYSVLRDPTTGQELLSEPVPVRLRLRSALTAVPELRVAERHEGGRTLLDLRWDHPYGAQVRVYRTTRPPVIGAALRDIAVTALPGAGLVDADQQLLPVTVSGGVGQMLGVTWPQDLPRVHLTAVTVSGNDARVGGSATRNRTTAVTSVTVVQRAWWQLLTFDWPAGTVSVEVHLTSPGTTLEGDARPPDQVLSEADYRRDGGIQMELPWHGCAVHLVPVSFYEGRPVKATTTTVAYPGLLLLRYRMTIPDVPASSARPGGGRFAGKLFGGAPSARPAAPSTLRTIELIRVSRGPGPAQVQLQVACTLVARPDRIPLSVQDADRTVGEMLVTVSTDGAPGWQPVGPTLDLAAYDGLHLRLFARLEPAVSFGVALLDPTFESLRAP